MRNQVKLKLAVGVAAFVAVGLMAGPVAAWDVLVTERPICVEGTGYVDVTYTNHEDETVTINQTKPTVDTFTVGLDEGITKRYPAGTTVTYKPTWPSDSRQPTETLQLDLVENCVAPSTTTTVLPTTTTPSTTAVPVAATTTTSPVALATPQTIELADTGFNWPLVVIGVIVALLGLTIMRRTRA